MKPPHELFDDPLLGPLAQALNAVESDWLMLQTGHRAAFLMRMRMSLRAATRSLDALEERISEQSTARNGSER